MLKSSKASAGRVSDSSSRTAMRRRGCRLAMAICGAAGLRSTAHAAVDTTYTWTTFSNGASLSWSPTGAWAGGAAPISSATTAVLFYGTSAPANTTLTGAGALNSVDDIGGGPFTLNVLTLAGTAATGGNTINLSGDALVLDGSSPTINLNGNSSGTNLLTYNVSDNLTLNQNVTFAGSGTAGFNFSGAISNGTSGTAITKSGASTLILSGSNSYTGGVTMSGGTLVGTTNSILGNIGSAAGTIDFDQTVAVGGTIAAGTYSSVISGTANVVKNSAGLVDFTGANSYGGTTTVNGGVLEVDSSNGGSLNSTTSLVLGGGGTFSFLGNVPATYTTLTVNGLTVSNTLSGLNVTGGGASTVVVDGNAAGANAGTLAVGPLTASTIGTSLNIITANNGVVTTSTGLDNGGSGSILSGRVILNGNDFAAGGSGLPIAAPLYAAISTGTIATNSGSTSTYPYVSSLGGSGTFTNSGTTYATDALKIIPSGASQTLNLNGGTLALLSGGLLYPSNSGQAYTITGGVLQAGTLSSGSYSSVPAAADLIINQYATGANKLTINSAIEAPELTGLSGTITSTGTLTVAGTFAVGEIVTLGTAAPGTGNSAYVSGIGTGTVALNNNGAFSYTAGPITVNVGPADSLTKTGPGTVVLGTTNIYTGGTYVDQGTLQLNGSNAKEIYNFLAPNELDYVAGGATLDCNFGGANSVTVGALSGSGTLTSSSATAGTITLNSQAATTTFAGSIYQQNAAFTMTVVRTGVNNMTLSGSANNTGPTELWRNTTFAGAANVLSPASVYWVLGQGSATGVGGPLIAADNNSYSGILDLNGYNQTIGGLAWGAAYSGTGVGSITSSSGALAILTVNPSGMPTPADSTFGGVIGQGAAGKLGITKAGSNTLTLASAETYSGPTDVTGGTLTIGTSILNSTSVTVDATVAAANLKLQNVAALSNSTNMVVLQPSAPSATIYLDFTGTQSVNSLLFNGSFIPAGIYTYGAGPTFTGEPTADQSLFGSDGASTGSLDVLNAPEPGTMGVLLVGAMGMLSGRRRRRAGLSAKA